jgi:hypothetical protein
MAPPPVRPARPDVKRPEVSLGAVLEELDRLQARCGELERRLAAVEDGRAAPEGEAGRPQLERAGEGELREDTFGPAVKRTSSSGHLNAVNKALSMLGLVPDRTEEDEARAKVASESHKRALNRAFDVLGREAPKRPAPAAEDAPESAAADEADESGSPRAAAPVDADAPRWESEVDVRRAEPAPVDLGEAVDIALENARGGRDFAGPVLNGAVLIVAGAAALHAAGIVALPGEGGSGAWLETATGAAAALLGALAFAWRRASIHLRAFAGGLAVLLLNALVLMLVRARAPLAPLPLLGVFAASAAVGARLVLATRHPLAIFLGLTAALLLPHWLTPGDFRATLAFALATNVAVGVCALRLRRLQPVVVAAFTTALLVAFAPAPYAAATAAACAALYLVLALTAPFLHNRTSKATSALALASFGMVAWATHGLSDGPGLGRAAGLFLPATLAVFAAGRLHRRERWLRAVLKGGAVALVLSSFPLGFSGHFLAAVTLFAALLFGVFAYATFDAYLWAAGALVLAVGVGLTLAGQPTPALWFGASLTALVLYAVRVKGRDFTWLRALLGGLVHGALMAGMASVAPAGLVPYCWGGLALACAAVPLDFALLRAGAALAAGAAVLWALFVVTPDPLLLGATTLLVAPHAWLARPRAHPRTSGLYLLLFEVMAVTTLLVGLAPPLGVLAAVPLLGVLVLPVWRAWSRMLRSHARFLAFVLLARCLFPDFLAYAVARPWLNLRVAAMCLALLPALVIAGFARRRRAPAAFLGLLVVAAAVATETGDWRSGLLALLPAGLVFGLLLTRNHSEPAAPEPEAESERAPAPTEADA